MNWPLILIISLVVLLWKGLSILEKLLDSLDKRKKNKELSDSELMGFLENQFDRKGPVYFITIVIFGLLFVFGACSLVMIFGYGFQKFIRLEGMQNLGIQVFAYLSWTVCAFLLYKLASWGGSIMEKDK